MALQRSIILEHRNDRTRMQALLLLDAVDEADVMM